MKLKLSKRAVKYCHYQSELIFDGKNRMPQVSRISRWQTRVAFIHVLVYNRRKSMHFCRVNPASIEHTHFLAWRINAHFFTQRIIRKCSCSRALWWSEIFFTRTPIFLYYPIFCTAPIPEVMFIPVGIIVVVFCHWAKMCFTIQKADTRQYCHVFPEMDAIDLKSVHRHMWPNFLTRIHKMNDGGDLECFRRGLYTK